MPVEQLATVAEVSTIWSGFSKVPALAQTALISTTSQKIIGFTRRPGFLAAMQNELKDGANNSALWLNMRPIISIAAITVNGEAVDNTDGLAWTINNATGKLVRGNSASTTPGQGDTRFQRWWPVGTQNILAQYWGGFDAVPDDIKMGVAFYCKFLRDKLGATGVFQSESLGDYSYTINATATKWGIPEVVLDLIMSYVQDDGPL